MADEEYKVEDKTKKSISPLAKLLFGTVAVGVIGLFAYPVFVPKQSAPSTLLAVAHIFISIDSGTDHVCGGQKIVCVEAQYTDEIFSTNFSETILISNLLRECQYAKHK